MESSSCAKGMHQKSPRAGIYLQGEKLSTSYPMYLQRAAARKGGNKAALQPQTQVMNLISCRKVKRDIRQICMGEKR